MSLLPNWNCKVTIFDERPHIARNCHTERDARSGVMVHAYGPHIFNTDREDVWKYVNHFAEFRPFVNRVKAVTNRGIFSLPINLHTINQFFGKSFNPTEAREFISSLGDKSIGEPANFEEQALKFLGREIYETFFTATQKNNGAVNPPPCRHRFSNACPFGSATTTIITMFRIKESRWKDTLE